MSHRRFFTRALLFSMIGWSSVTSASETRAAIVIGEVSARAVDADEAVRLARLGRAGTGTELVKLEVTPDPRTLAPDPIGLGPRAEKG